MNTLTAFEQGSNDWDRDCHTNPFSRTEQPDEWDNWNIGFKMRETEFEGGYLDLE